MASARIGSLRRNPHIAAIKQARHAAKPCLAHRVLVSYSKGRKKMYCTRCGYQTSIEA